MGLYWVHEPARDGRGTTKVHADSSADAARQHALTSIQGPGAFPAVEHLLLRVLPSGASLEMWSTHAKCTVTDTGDWQITVSAKRGM